MTIEKISISKIIGQGYNKAWNTKKFYKVIKGSRGSKKSVTTQIEIISKMMAYPWMNVIAARRYQNTLRDSVYVGLKSATHRLGVSHLWNFTVSPMEATYIPTGQKILFRGFDDPLKMTSIQLEKGTITHLWVEEAYELESRDKLDTVTEAMRGKIDESNAYRQVILTFNPWSENHWLKSEFFDKEDEDVFTLTTTYKINEFLDKDTIRRYEKLYKTNPRRAKIVCDGEWGVAEGLVFENVIFEPFDIQEKLKEQLQLLIGLDFGYEHDPTALIVALLDEENEKIYIIDEHYEKGMRTKEIANMIKKKGYQKLTIVADSADGRLIDELRDEHGIRRITRSEKGPGSVKQGIEQLKNYQIICHTKCENAKEEFYSYAYKKDKISGKYLNEAEDKNNHLMDALRYSLQCRKSKIIIKTYKGGIL
ncbi:MAG TPA: PBSX family phage terminase large subunit [Tissierellales bacterium]|nr:PBSX family phage terminase large subunit [Tissierellales bacterium]